MPPARRPSRSCPLGRPFRREPNADWQLIFPHPRDRPSGRFDGLLCHAEHRPEEHGPPGRWRPPVPANADADPSAMAVALGTSPISLSTNTVSGLPGRAPTIRRIGQWARLIPRVLRHLHAGLSQKCPQRVSDWSRLERIAGRGREPACNPCGSLSRVAGGLHDTGHVEAQDVTRECLSDNTVSQSRFGLRRPTKGRSQYRVTSNAVSASLSAGDACASLMPS